MKKIAYSVLAVAAIAAPHAAFAQETKAEVTLGATAGYHDLGIAEEVKDLTGVDVDDGSPIFGGFLSVDVPVADSAFIGFEANANLGTDALDADYGGSVRVGYRAANGTKVYLRGGYQFVEIDYANMLNVPANAIPGGLDDTFDDFLVGGGVDIPVGRFALRVNLDTVSFDTLRATAGFGVRF